MSFINHRAKRMTTKLVKEHIKVFVLKSINDNNTPNTCLTDTKISDIQRLFVIKENDYRPLITSLFEKNSFINDITAAQEFFNPINTQDILPSKKNLPFFFFI